MTNNVSVGFSANPAQVVDAIKQVTAEAKRLGHELRSVQDLDLIPGLDNAKREILEVNASLGQMMSTAVRSNQANTLRAGVKSGLYKPDVISVFNGIGKQFGSDDAAQRNLEGIIRQSQRIGSMGGGISGGTAGGGGGFGLGGMMPMLKGMLPFLGVGMGLGFAKQKLDGATDEAISMSDLRKSVNGTGQEFDRFRDIIREAGDGLGVLPMELAELTKRYAEQSGSRGGASTSIGTEYGLTLARGQGLDAGWGVQAMGRASWLGVGKNEDESFRKLAEIMAGSNLGRRQTEAAEAILKFAERSNQFSADGGNLSGFMNKYLALINSKDPGIRNNAESIFSSLDESVRAGGNAGDAGRNLMWNAYSQHGVSSVFQMEALQKKGFTAQLPDGKMAGEAIIEAIKRLGGDQDMQNSRLGNFFGVSPDVIGKAIKQMETYRSDPDKIKAAIADIEREAKNAKDPGAKARETQAEIERQLADAMEGLIEPLNDFKKAVIGFTKTVNKVIDYLPDYGVMKERGNDAKSAFPVLGMLDFGSRFKRLYDMTNGPQSPKSSASPLLADMFKQNDNRRKIADGINETAKSLGIDPAHLAAAISYETAGTFDPSIAGPTTQHGQHRGLIQWGESQAKQFGVDWDDPIGSQLGKGKAIEKYLKARGVKPGMGMMDIYSAINAGHVGLYDRSDAKNGGAPGTVKDKVLNQMAPHYEKAKSLLSESENTVHVTGEVTVKDTSGKVLGKAPVSGSRIRPPKVRLAGASGGW